MNVVNSRDGTSQQTVSRDRQMRYPIWIGTQSLCTNDAKQHQQPDDKKMKNNGKKAT